MPLKTFYEDGSEFEEPVALRTFAEDGSEVQVGKAKPAPPKPKPKPKKAPRQPVSAGIFAPGAKPSESEVAKRARLFGQELTGTPAEPGLDPEGLTYEIQGGPTARITTSKPGISFDRPITGLTQQGEPMRAIPVGVRRRPDETLDAYMKRAEAFEAAKQQKEKQERAERAAVRAKALPMSRNLKQVVGEASPVAAAFMESPGVGQAIGGLLEFGSEKYPTAFQGGMNEGLRQAGNEIVKLGEAFAGIENNSAAAQMLRQLPLPNLNEKEAQEYWVKQAQSLGTMVPALATSWHPVGRALGTAYMGLQSGGEIYDDAISKGASPEEAFKASIPAIGIGLLQGLVGVGTGKWIENIANTNIKGFAKNWLEEQFQEVILDQGLKTVNAKYLSGYDPKRALTEGMWETFLQTIPMATAFHAPGLAKGGLGRSGVEFSIGELAPEPGGPRLFGGLAFPSVQRMEFNGQPTEIEAIPDPSDPSLPQVSREEAQANLAKFMAQSQVKNEAGEPIPLYHGTQSPTEIQEIDPSKFDKGALYGPGFYMTQDPEVAAGEGGYSTTKLPSGVRSGWGVVGDAVVDLGPWDASDYEASNKIIEQYFIDHPGLTWNDLDYREGGKLDTLIYQDRLARKGPKPHAYKLYADIRNPLDIDAIAESNLIDKVEYMDGARGREGRLGSNIDNRTLYEKIVRYFNGDKGLANQWLQQQGYDGITHTGGRSRGTPRTIGYDEAKAQEEAQRAGGRVTRDPDTGEYQVEGHRVWIAFRPEQVKSATGNIGTYDPANKNISYSNPIFDPSLWKAGIRAWKDRKSSNLTKFMEGSQVRDNKGNPKRVYHGTPQKGVDIQSFQKEKANPSDTISGFYFTESPSVASDIYAVHGNLLNEANPANPAEAGATYPAYLALRNPLDLDLPLNDWDPQALEVRSRLKAGADKVLGEGAGESLILFIDRYGNNDNAPHTLVHFLQRASGPGEFLENQKDRLGILATRIIKAAGYDGATYLGANDANTGNTEPHRTWIAFEPTQIKSATGNRGDYNPSNPNISFSLANEPNRITYDDALGAEMHLRDLAKQEGRELTVKERKYIDDLYEKADKVVNLAGEEKLDLSKIKLKVPTDPTRTPTLYVPGSLFLKLGYSGAGPMGVEAYGGLMLEDSSQSKNFRQKMSENLTPEEYQEVDAQLRTAEAVVRSRGIQGISITNRDTSFGNIRGNLRHESWHVGQADAAQTTSLFDPSIIKETLLDLHSPDMNFHPLVKKAGESAMGKAVMAASGNYPDVLAMELSAYFAAGQNLEFGITDEEAAQYLTDYLSDIVENRGIAALDTLVSRAWIKPSTKEIIQKVRSKYEGPKETNATVGTGTRESGTSQPRGAVPTIASIGDATGKGEGTGKEAGTGDVGASEIGEGEAQLGEVDENKGSVFTLNTEDPPIPGTAVDDSPSAGPISPSDTGPPTPPSTEIGPFFHDEALLSAGINPHYIKNLMGKLRSVMMDLGIKPNPTVPAHEQLMAAVGNRDIKTDEMIRAMARHGITLEEWIEALDRTAELYGRGLQSFVLRNKAYQNILADDPSLAKKLGNEQTLKLGISALEHTELGQGLFQRSADIIRKNYLSRLATTFTQVWSVHGQMPLDFVSGAMAGLGMRILNPQKWQTTPDAGLMQQAKESMLRGVIPVLEVARGTNPIHIAKMLRTRSLQGPQQEYENVINILRKELPDIYGKLHGREGFKSADENITGIDELESYLENVKDPVQRREYAQKLRILKRRERFNKTLAGKSLENYEEALNTILIPLSLQEYMYRRPVFVGALKRELEAQGISLEDVLADPSLIRKYEKEVRIAVDEALRVTWAYEPKRDNKQVGTMDRGLEATGYYFIKGVNKFGPIATVAGQAFPRAFYNGLKFAYEWSPLGLANPAWEVASKVRHGERETITFQEAQRLAQGITGFAMYAIALGVRETVGGPEWWQIKTGRKDKKGNPVYYDVRRIPQVAYFLGAADLAKRVKDGTMTHLSAGRRLSELYLNAQRQAAPGEMGTIDYFTKMWAGEAVPGTVGDKLLARPAGDFAAIFVYPLVNIRDAYAQFNEETGVKKDLRESPFTGPIIDKLPWLRNSLPNLEGPFEPAPQLRAFSPISQGRRNPFDVVLGLTSAIGATPVTAGQNFAAQEFARLGLSPFRFLKRDPDPTIDRAQWNAMAQFFTDLGQAFEQDPSYQSASDKEKAARWEMVLTGPDGFSSIAKQLGLAANPEEAARRALLEAGPGPLQNRALGLDKEVERMRQQSKERAKSP